MGEALGKIVEEIVGICKRNNKRPKFWFSVAFFIFIFILLIPYIDSNFFYFSRAEKRIDILQKIMTLDQDIINSNQAYIDEYQSILQEIEQQRERSINSLITKFIGILDQLIGMGKGEGIGAVKFFTGALWCIIITICIPFLDTFEDKSSKVISFVFMGILSLIIGGVCYLIPIVINPMVNYVGIPILQLLAAIFILNKSGRKDKAD